MQIIIGVRFRPIGKIYFFDPVGEEFAPGDHVIVETTRGVEFGYVAIGNRELRPGEHSTGIAPIVRRATAEDEETNLANKEKEKEAFGICLEKIAKHGLEMKLIECEYTFDNKKVLFYFSANGRIDFRNLVKDLAAVFRTRIELRQIGVRDQAKALGGIGICGRPLCCCTYLSEFSLVSIKMAKDQSISLNPSKLSGNCGRLMCCMRNEQLAYEELIANLPGVGDHVTTSDGLAGEVSSVNVLKQIVRVILTLDNGDKEARDYKPSELTFKARKRKSAASAEEMKAMRELEKLDEQEGNSHLDD